MNPTDGENRARYIQRQMVIRRELAWQEEEAHRRHSIDKFLYGPPAFARIIQSGVSFLDAQPGELVVDLACGEGKETFELARRGLRVISIDLSHSQLSRTRVRLGEREPSLSVHYVQGNVEQLPFARNSLGSIYGKAVLHHLDLDIAQQEVNRVLKPEGRAAFAEPMAHHPVFRWARRLTPRLRTQDEHPLTLTDIECFASSFPRYETEAAFLLAPAAYLVRLVPGLESVFSWLHKLLQQVDSWLFRRLPATKKLAWYRLIHIDGAES